MELLPPPMEKIQSLYVPSGPSRKGYLTQKAVTQTPAQSFSIPPAQPGPCPLQPTEQAKKKDPYPQRLPTQNHLSFPPPLSPWVSLPPAFLSLPPTSPPRPPQPATRLPHPPLLLPNLLLRLAPRVPPTINLHAVAVPGAPPPPLLPALRIPAHGPLHHARGAALPQLVDRADGVDGRVQGAAGVEVFLHDR